MEENKELQETQLHNEPLQKEQEEKKPSILILIIGFFLIIRGIMRYSQGELGIFGIVMIIIGVINVVYYLSKRL